MSGLLLRICAVDRCSHDLFNEYQHLTQVHKKALLNREAAAAATARSRRRRAIRAPVTLLQKHRQVHGYRSLPLPKSLWRHLDMASLQEIRRRPSAADRTPLTESVIAARATTTMFASPPDMTRPGMSRSASSTSIKESSHRLNDAIQSHRDGINIDMTMPPPPLPQDDGMSKRHSRGSSVASRHMNRLSLTLPIALPTSDFSRGSPSTATTTSATTIGMAASLPPTPIETPRSASPSDTDEFIIGIAAQERRVLELREELSRAEADLIKLKREWASKEGLSKRVDKRHSDLTKHMTPTTIDDDGTSRRSVDLDRRKLMLLQTQNQNTPTQGRRRVMRGGHARTLSLLSPVKPEGFSLHDDTLSDTVTLPSIERRTAQLTNPNLAKRASWQPRTQQTASVVGVPQLVEDFKLGLRAFVEDIRQITVGDEPVTGQPQRSIPAANSRNGVANKDQSTVRAKSNTERPSTATATSMYNAKTPEAAPEKKTGRMKHFSWTPLGFDSLDDNDWSNWDSPASSKSARWSGSTINSGSDDIQSIPENGEVVTPSKPKSSNIGTPILTPSLEDILPSVVNRLTPSSIKRTATILMDEWEKSLMAPESRIQENSA